MYLKSNVKRNMKVLIQEKEGEKEMSKYLKLVTRGKKGTKDSESINVIENIIENIDFIKIINDSNCRECTCNYENYDKEDAFHAINTAKVSIDESRIEHYEEIEAIIRDIENNGYECSYNYTEGSQMVFIFEYPYGGICFQSIEDGERAICQATEEITIDCDEIFRIPYSLETFVV